MHVVDAAKLKQQYRVAVRSCLGITAIPFLLAFVGYMISTSPDPSGAERAAADPAVLAVFGILALSPLLTVPVNRRTSRKLIASEKQPPAGIESNISMWAITEYALWEISSLLGFVGFVMGAPVAFFGACILITLAGFAYSFPRWSRWVALIEDLGLRADMNALSLV